MATFPGHPRLVTGRVASRARRTTVAAAATCSLVGLLAACGSGSSSGSSSGSTDLPAKVPSIAAMVPSDVAKKGTLLVAGAIYPPAYIAPPSGGTPTGWDIENTRDIAAVLGLKAEFKPIPFDGVITGLQAGRYDAATGEIYITPDRTKSVTFVTNHHSTDALLVPSDSKITSASTEDSLCGLTLAAELGSAEAALVDKIASTCASEGKPKVTAKTFQTQASVNLALNEGRIDGAINSASQVAYVLSQTGGKFKLVQLPWAPGYDTGLALARNSETPQLAKAVQAATNYLIKNGTLQKILDKFNDGQGGIKQAEIVPSNAG